METKYTINKIVRKLEKTNLGMSETGTSLPAVFKENKQNRSSGKLPDK